MTSPETPMLPRPSALSGTDPSTRRRWLRRFLGFLLGTASLFADPPSTNAQSCSDWFRCGMAGCLCSCRGGSDSRCPPGTVNGTSAWYACCYDRARNKVFFVRYTDCCSNTQPPACPSGCFCSQSAQPSWCGSAGTYVVCTRAVLVGVC